MRRRDVLKLSGCAAMLTPLTAPRIGNAQAAKPLRFVHDSDIAILDPVVGSAYQRRDHGFMIFDTLYGQDKAYRARPQMVEGHTTEHDGRIWTLTLRPELMFHDGTKVLARDAVASVARWGKRDSFGQALMAHVDEMSAIDDRTMRFRLKIPFPHLPYALAHISPPVCGIMPARLAETDAFKAVTEMIGSGPFRFKADERVSGVRVVYEKFNGYVPRDEPAEGTAGGKRVHIERVEWLIMPDGATAANALIKGEIDWLYGPQVDLLPFLRKSPDIVFPLLQPTGAMPLLRFNQLHPPFDSPAIRRAIMHAVSQADYMTAVQGDNASLWQDGVGYFCPDTPMASSAGMDNLTGKRDIAVARKELDAAGYRGERVVLLMPSDFPKFKALADVTADLLQKLGVDVDVQAMDFGSMVKRRLMREPVGQGGWSIFASIPAGIEFLNPAVEQLPARQRPSGDHGPAGQCADRDAARRMDRNRRPGRAKAGGGTTAIAGVRRCALYPPGTMVQPNGASHGPDGGADGFGAVLEHSARLTTAPLR